MKKTTSLLWAGSEIEAQLVDCAALMARNRLGGDADPFRRFLYGESFHKEEIEDFLLSGREDSFGNLKRLGR